MRSVEYGEMLESLDDRTRDILERAEDRLDRFYWEYGDSPWYEPCWDDLLLPIGYCDRELPGTWIDPYSYQPSSGLVRVYVAKEEPGEPGRIWLNTLEGECFMYACRMAHLQRTLMDDGIVLTYEKDPTTIPGFLEQVERTFQLRAFGVLDR